MTFCVTWVVDRIVVAHLRKPVVGMASGMSMALCACVPSPSLTSCKTEADSNQKRQVICQMDHELGSGPSHA